MKALRRIVVWVALSLALAGTHTLVRAASMSGSVTRVIDGETLDVKVRGGARERVRLQGIDAPEQRQAHGRESTLHLRELALRRPVRVDVFGHDRNGRWVGRVWIEQPGACPQPANGCARSVDLGLTQVRDGMAWHYRQYAGEQDALTRGQYAAAEREARATRRGLWASPRPMPPWSWRHRYSR